MPGLSKIKGMEHSRKSWAGTIFARIAPSRIPRATVRVLAWFVTLVHFFLQPRPEREIGGILLLHNHSNAMESSPLLSIFPATKASKCSTAVPNLQDFYRSQFREDRKLLQWFSNICNGTYIEMGALDGVSISNSYLFNKALGWRGVLVELNSDNYEKLVKNRMDEIATVHAGVCGEPKKLHYFGKGGTGGIYELAAPSFRKRWWGSVSLDDPRVKEIDCDTLDNLLLKHAPAETYFDFFSLDVEGAELSVLEAIDYERVQFGVIFVEADGHNVTKNAAVRRLLEKEGYVFVMNHQSFWFLNPFFDGIYERIGVKSENGIQINKWPSFSSVDSIQQT